jgi:hypothetical protein
MNINDLSELPHTNAFLKRVGAEPRSMTRAVVKEMKGAYWEDIAVLKFSKLGDVDAPEGYTPNEVETIAIKAEFATINWPEQVYVDLSDSNLPDLVTQANPEDVYQFKDFNGNILMLQVKKVQKGQKSYWPVTKWSDGQYRIAEGEGLLPLYGAEELKHYSTCFIHEGAASAKAGQEIRDGKRYSPWAEEFKEAAHVGFVGGALSPHRTDWSVIQKAGVTRAYCCPDNDSAGLSAVTKIAERLSCPTFSLQVSSEWGSGWDHNDEWPSHFFKEIGGKKFYIGPSFRDCLRYATWTTNKRVYTENNKQKVAYSIRNHVKDQWAFIYETNEFINTEFPEMLFKPEMLDSVLRPFSDVKKVSELLLEGFGGQTAKLAYRPDLKARRIIDNGKTALNIYTPGHIKPQDGDVTPFMSFLEYLFPIEKDRYEVKRWIATLLGRPDVRLSYACLCVSEQTGTGKSTLGEKILAPIIGHGNCSFPNESDITDNNFNSWIAGKRLAIVNEIYAGSSFKAANRLKSILTDSWVDVNEKFRIPYRLQNFITAFACSNSFKALKFDDEERRWLVPTVTEVRWPKKTFDEFHSWLSSGGLSIIYNWALNFDDYVEQGDVAPATSRKLDMITESRGDVLNAALDLGKMLAEDPQPRGMGMLDCIEWLKTHSENGRFFETKHDIKKALKKAGVKFSAERISVDSRTQDVFFNDALAEMLMEQDGKGSRNTVWKKHRVKPADIMNERF